MLLLVINIDGYNNIDIQRIGYVTLIFIVTLMVIVNDDGYVTARYSAYRYTSWRTTSWTLCDG